VCWLPYFAPRPLALTASCTACGAVLPHDALLARGVVVAGSSAHAAAAPAAPPRAAPRATVEI